MKESFPTTSEYLIAANPDVITSKYIGITSKKQAYDQKVATLNHVNQAYGRDAVVLFVRGWLIKLNDWVNVSEEKKLSVPQMMEIANFIFNDFRRLKISEMAYCFTLIKKGEYGDFYGSISPSMILSAFKKYVSQRNDTFEALERNGTLSFSDSVKCFKERAEDIQKALDRQ